MIAIANFLATAVFVSLAYVYRDSNYLLGIFTGIAGLTATYAIQRISIIERNFVLATLACGSIWRWRTIRVSISYLYSIPVGDKQLLVRGHRITTQFQPVGGVFKTYLTTNQLLNKFAATPDNRFSPDAASRSDLRLLVPGRNVYKLLRWFRSRHDRELLPVREFYEELVKAGHLSTPEFAYFDCKFIGLHHLPMKFDQYSKRMQLIVSEVYRLIPTHEQNEALLDLEARNTGAVDQIYFADNTEIDHGGAVSVSSTEFDLAPTTKWLLKE